MVTQSRGPSRFTESRANSPRSNQRGCQALQCGRRDRQRLRVVGDESPSVARTRPEQRRLTSPELRPTNAGSACRKLVRNGRPRASSGGPIRLSSSASAPQPVRRHVECHGETRRRPAQGARHSRWSRRPRCRRAQPHAPSPPPAAQTARRGTVCRIVADDYIERLVPTQGGNDGEVTQMGGLKEPAKSATVSPWPVPVVRKALVPRSCQPALTARAAVMPPMPALPPRVAKRKTRRMSSVRASSSARRMRSSLACSRHFAARRPRRSRGILRSRRSYRRRPALKNLARPAPEELVEVGVLSSHVGSIARVLGLRSGEDRHVHVHEQLLVALVVFGVIDGSRSRRSSRSPCRQPPSSAWIAPQGSEGSAPSRPSFPTAILGIVHDVMEEDTSSCI